MYQHHNSTSSSLHKVNNFIASSSDGDELFLLFDKYPTTHPTSFSSNDRTEQQSSSAPASADASPYMSEKECPDQPETEDPGSPSNFNSKSRRSSLNKAERRAEHNAIERARRECLNSKFQQLAEVLPNLKNHRRPSKGQIVEKALDWVKQNMTKEDRYQYQIMQLQNENKRLITQINIAHDHSSNSGVVTPPITSTSPINAGPFLTTYHQQQQQRFSTDSIDVTTIKQENNHNAAELNAFYNNQSKEVTLMYPMIPLGVDWQNQPGLTHQNNFDCLMPSASSSSSSRLLHDDDNESSSSNDELQKQHTHMTYQNSAMFEMNQTGSIAPWSKMQQHIPNHPYQLNYGPPNTNTNLDYCNGNSYLS